MPKNSEGSKLKNLALNFDLDTEKTKAVFGSRGTAPAYTAIKEYLEAHGFEHRQYSGYRTVEPMDQLEALRIVKETYQSFPWLCNCVQRMDLTTIEKLFDLHEVIMKEQEDLTTNPPEKKPPSLESRIKPAKEVSGRIDSHGDKPPNHDDPNL